MYLYKLDVPLLIDISCVCSYMLYMTCLKMTVQLKSVVECKPFNKICNCVPIYIWRCMNCAGQSH